MLHLIAYDRAYLDRSYKWLIDPEVKALTMTPDFNRDDQEAFFAGLADRADYRIWGVAVDGVGPAGAAGIKRIAGTRGEYWGYLGEKTLWGQGLGRRMVIAVEEQARTLGLVTLYLDVAQTNARAIGLYHSMGYVDGNVTDGVLRMEKAL